MVVPIVILVLAVFGCQDKAAMTELEEYRAQAKVEKENKDIVRQYMEAWSKEDIAGFKKLMSLDYEYYSPSRNSEALSLAETLELGKTIFKAFPDFKWTIVESVAEADTVVVRMNLSGTHEGEWSGIPATGKRVQISSICILRIKNGLIAEERDEVDNLGTFQQLGMQLASKETPETE